MDIRVRDQPGLYRKKSCLKISTNETTKNTHQTNKHKKALNLLQLSWHKRNVSSHFFLVVLARGIEVLWDLCLMEGRNTHFSLVTGMC